MVIDNDGCRSAQTVDGKGERLVIKTCGKCLGFERTWCNVKGKRVSFSRVGCEDWDDGLSRPPIPDPVRDQPKVKVELSPTRIEKISRAYRATGSISAAAMAGGVSWNRAKEIIRKYGNVTCGCGVVLIDMASTRWDDGKACEEWQRKKALLVDNHLEPHEPGTCICPTCGRTICSQCQ